MKRSGGSECICEPKRPKTSAFGSREKFCSKRCEISTIVESRVIEYFEQSRDAFLGLEKLPLLKKIEEESQRWFEEIFLVDVEDKEKVLQITCQGDFESVENFSEEFYHFLELGAARNDCTRTGIELALERLQHGFDDFDVALIRGGSAISNAYGPYYESWFKAVNNTSLKSYLESNPPEINSPLLNPFSISTVDENNSVSTIPFTTAFQTELAPIIQAIEALISSIEELSCDDHGYLTLLRHYLLCFRCVDLDQFEALFAELDRKWMSVDYWIQFIHDIETGYCDPLNTKMIPDFVVRLLNSEYERCHQEIDKVKLHMTKYFTSRKTELSSNGIKALAKSSSGVYYVPFHCGCSLHMRTVGQCIPNRPEVKTETGIKIFLNPGGIAQYQHEVQKAIRSIFKDSDRLCASFDVEEEMIYLTSTHEVGHAIYNLESIESHPDRLSTLLEEPRVELCALFTVKLLRDTNVISTEQMMKYATMHLTGEVRRFRNRDKRASGYAYVISAINLYKIAVKVGLVRFSTPQKELLEFQESKIEAYLAEVEKTFLHILDLMDERKISELNSLLASFEEQNEEIIEFLFKKLAPKEKIVK